MVNVTLFEIRLDDASFSSNIPFLGSADEESGLLEAVTDEGGTQSKSGEGKSKKQQPEGSEESGGMSIMMMALVAMAVAGAAWWAMNRGGSDEGGKSGKSGGRSGGKSQGDEEITVSS
ncbi:MAG: hypothetical protein ABEJ31_04650 [Haloarculaceae archaeon]